MLRTTNWLRWYVPACQDKRSAALSNVNMLSRRLELRAGATTYFPVPSFTALSLLGHFSGVLPVQANKTEVAEYTECNKSSQYLVMLGTYAYV